MSVLFWNSGADLAERYAFGNILTVVDAVIGSICTHITIVSLIVCIVKFTIKVRKVGFFLVFLRFSYGHYGLLQFSVWNMLCFSSVDVSCLSTRIGFSFLLPINHAGPFNFHVTFNWMSRASYIGNYDIISIVRDHLVHFDVGRKENVGKRIPGTRFPFYCTFGCFSCMVVFFSFHYFIERIFYT